MAHFLSGLAKIRSNRFPKSLKPTNSGSELGNSHCFAENQSVALFPCTVTSRKRGCQKKRDSLRFCHSPLLDVEESKVASAGTCFAKRTKSPNALEEGLGRGKYVCDSLLFSWRPTQIDTRNKGNVYLGINSVSDLFGVPFIYTRNQLCPANHESNLLSV